MEMLGKQIKKKSFFSETKRHQRNKDDEDSWHTNTFVKTTCCTANNAAAVVHTIYKGRQGNTISFHSKRARGRAVWVAMVMAAFLPPLC